MAEVLSASTTVHRLYRFGPLLLLVVFAFGAPAAFGASDPVRLALRALAVPLLLLFHLYGRQFKQVALLDSCLVVSDRTGSIHVPLARIVRASRMVSGIPVVMLVLREPSVMGRNILFIPTNHDISVPEPAAAVIRRLQHLLAQSPSVVCVHGSQTDRHPQAPSDRHEAA